MNEPRDSEASLVQTLTVHSVPEQISELCNNYAQIPSMMAVLAKVSLDLADIRPSLEWVNRNHDPLA